MLPDIEFTLIPPAPNYAEIELSIDSTVRIDFDVGEEIGGGGRLPDYEGEYVVTPDLYDKQVLSTKNKSLSDDVTVLKVPYEEVTNLGGGYTAVIGYED